MKMDWNNYHEACQTNVKHEPWEIDHFNEWRRHETDFVDHEHNYAVRSCQELSKEKFGTVNLNREDLDHSKFSENWKIDCMDSNKDFQTDAVKHEPWEIDHFNEWRRQETDFVDHDHNYAARSCQELSKEKFGTVNLNRKDLDHSKFSENWKIDCMDLNKDFQTDAVKQESCEIDNFSECGRHDEFSTVEADFEYHRNATSGCHEQNEEKLDVKNLNPEDLNLSECSEISVQCNTAQFKKEDIIDIVYEDIKCDVGEEKSSNPFRFCEVCYQSFDKETDFFKSTSYVTECSCQKQNEPHFYNILGEDKTHDVTSASLSFMTDSGLQQHDVQDEAISRNEVIKEQDIPSIHTENNPFYCKICFKVFATSDTLRVHGKTHIGEKPFHCQICSKSFGQMRYLKVHVMRHTAIKSYYCKICFKVFATSNTLRVHGKTHIGKKTFNCQICSKSFGQMRYLKVHVMRHTGVKSHYCKICFMAFTTSDALKTHGSFHTGGKPFQCKICSKSFSQISVLKIHERVHTGEKPFICKFCSKSFSQKGSLTIHERVHTGEKGFHCKICSKSFGHMKYLKAHEMVVHTGKKLYDSKICFKPFTILGELKTHGRIHTGEKPFHCQFCSKSFGQMRYLKAHEMWHTGVKPH